MRSPADVARDLRWRVVRDVLLDPFVWVGGVLLALVLVRVGGWLEVRAGGLAVLAAAPLLSLGLGLGLADALLFRSAENDLLRTQPLGPTGLLQVRKAELGWWLQATSLLGAAVAFGAGGLPAAGAAYVAGRCAVSGAAAAAILCRGVAGRAGAGLGLVGVAGLAVGLLLAGSLLGAPAPPWVGAAVPAGLGLALGLTLPSLWASRYELLASDAASAPSTPRAPVWAALARVLPLPAPLKARVLRDLTLLLRGNDGRGAILLLLSPAAVLTLRLDPTPTGGQLLWQALSAAALGGGAIAYAVGPGVHRLRVQVLAWARTAPNPGGRALMAGLLWGSLWAVLHGGLVLAYIGLARDGWFVAELSRLALPVLALELCMAHFGVVFTLSRALGQTVNGEGMLAFALPAVAIGVALAGVLFPAAILLYPILTAGMTAEAAHRLDRVEVTW